MLRDLRQAWKIHTLAEEIVVYRALESVEAANDSDSLAGRRFVEHELIEGLFDKLSRGKVRTSEWKARLDVLRELLMRHIEAEHEVLLPALAQRFDAQHLAEMARQFDSACAKLAMLEEAKAA
jgi:hemerythrin-like domain-containing protein